MVIDTHIHPALFAPICEDQERFRRRCDDMNYHLMKPSDMALLRKQYALADIGRVVLLPEDCSVVGIDGIDMSAYVVPTLTTLVQPQEEMGERSVRILVDMIEERAGNCHLLLDTEVRSGGSVCRI